MTSQPSYVYLAARNDGFIKIGVSKYPDERIASLSIAPISATKAPAIDLNGLNQKQRLAKRRLSLLRTVRGDYRDEARVHRAMEVHRVKESIEWFHDTAESRRMATDHLDRLEALHQGGEK